ncbi:MAG: cytochrome C, partial [Myxococcales bacterium]|nr:cytochrome C [Myxococcales bacterium]
ESAHVLYMLQCQGCHLPDGRGLAGSVPDLRDSIARFLRLPEGRAYLVQVPGSASSRLSDAELAAVLNWMAQAFGPAADARVAAPYDEAEVARHRRTPLLEVAPVRAALVERMTP